jgi:hypothetical protein
LSYSVWQGFSRYCTPEAGENTHITPCFTTLYKYRADHTENQDYPANCSACPRLPPTPLLAVGAERPMPTLASCPKTIELLVDACANSRCIVEVGVLRLAAAARGAIRTAGRPSDSLRTAIIRASRYEPITQTYRELNTDPLNRCRICTTNRNSESSVTDLVRFFRCTLCWQLPPPTTPVSAGPPGVRYPIW